MANVYVNPFTDYGFKKIFGEEVNKAILIDFLNALLKQESKIIDLTFRNNEQLGSNLDAKGVIFDIYCENEKGEKFIIELQKSKQNWFKERTIYYSTFPIREQVEKGDWNYDLKAVYCIGILDFVFNDYATEIEKKEWLHEIKLKNQHGSVFYDKLTYLYLEMPNFAKRENDLVTQLDKWLYFIKHLQDFQTIPEIFRQEVVFINAFKTAEIAGFNKAQLESYEYSMKGYRDFKSLIDTAKGDGEREGIEKGIEIGVEKGIEIGVEKGIEIGVEKGIEIGIEKGGKNQQKIIAINCHKQGMQIENIAQITGLTIEVIKELLK